MIRLLGAAFLIAGSGGFGFLLAASHRREMKMLQCLIHGVQEMEWELKYRMTELPELCLIGANAAGGVQKEILADLAGRLSRGEVNNISGCMNAILSKFTLPNHVRKNLRQLGLSLGRFDLEGQIQGLEAVRMQCRKDLKDLKEGSSQRMRNYQTLALCAGLALAVLFI